MAEIKSIRKHIVTDEHNRPVAVQIDYEDWLEIERQLRAEGGEMIREPSAGDTFSGLLDATQGIWTEGDGLEYQKRIRQEWTRP
jgi:hypothetical protein